MRLVLGILVCCFDAYYHLIWELYLVATCILIQKEL